MGKYEVEALFSPEEVTAIGAEMFGPKCSACPLRTVVNKHPRMKWTGLGGKKALIVGEAPGTEEDIQGEQFVGPTGEKLEKDLKALGFSLKKDFWKTNSVNCRASDSDDIKKAVPHCHQMLLDAIKELDPDVVILFGNNALASFLLGKKFATKNISDWMQTAIPYEGRWYIPCLHPTATMHAKGNDIVEAIWQRCLSFALSYVGKPRPPIVNPYDHIKVIPTYTETVSILNKIADAEPEIFFFDFETTSIKPYQDPPGKRQKILTMSFCTSADMAYSFVFDHPLKRKYTQEQLMKIVDPVVRIMENPKIKKVSHSVSMEKTWLRSIVEIEPVNFQHCTMVSAHVIDGRKNHSGLKFLSFINWGFYYGDDMDQYKSSGKKGEGKGYNKMEYADLPKLLTYCATDSLIGFWVLMKQEEFFNDEAHEQLRDARDFYLLSNNNLIDIHTNGIYMDKAYYEAQDKECEKELKALEEIIATSEEAQKYERMEKERFDHSSNAHVEKLLYRVLGLPVTKQTETKKGSTDEEVLTNLEYPIGQHILKWRKLDKLKGTYIAQFLREIDPDGRMRPFFPLNTVSTYRGSSTDPNFQNIPKHDVQAKKLVRSGIKPSPGNILLDWDYGAMEVRIIACYSRDKKLVSYINDPKSDMHKDESRHVYGLKVDEVTKQIRQVVKNSYVFPMFYKSLARNCANNLWKEGKKLMLANGMTIYKHLHKVGITSTPSADVDFFAYVEKEALKFWDRFSGVKEWQDRSVSDFIQFGYLEQFFGFRVSGLLDERKLGNYRVQGTAFHCLLWSMNHIIAEMKRRGLKSKVVGQIHDNCIYDLFPPEREEVIEITEYYAVKKIREEHPWMIVPLLVEWEETAIDGSWTVKDDKEDDLPMEDDSSAEDSSEDDN